MMARRSSRESEDNSLRHPLMVTLLLSIRSGSDPVTTQLGLISSTRRVATCSRSASEIFPPRESSSLWKRDNSRRSCRRVITMSSDMGSSISGLEVVVTQEVHEALIVARRHAEDD